MPLAEGRLYRFCHAAITARRVPTEAGGAVRCVAVPGAISPTLSPLHGDHYTLKP